MYGKLEKLNDDLQNVQVKNPNLNKAVNFLRNQLSSRYGDFLKTNEEDMYKLYPYPEVREFYQPFVSYLKQRIATPNKKSLAAEREPAFKKLDAAILAILRNALYTNFKGGQVVVNVSSKLKSINQSINRFELSFFLIDSNLYPNDNIEKVAGCKPRSWRLFKVGLCIFQTIS